MLITPDYISSLVNFYSNSLEPNWKFDLKGDDMRNLQVKGAAKAFNLLEEKKLALLADEVGMGKTIQALAVCAALWNQNPKARVLVLAPRDEIARNWEKEYQNFVFHHYRHSDNIVKGMLDGKPTRKMIYCRNLYALVHEIQQGWGKLFIGKISSFSGLMAGNKSIERLETLNIKASAKTIRLSENSDLAYNNEIMRLLKTEIVSHADHNKPYFDLVIIDEAHYFRNKEGGSLRVNSAGIFFGDPAIPDTIKIAKQVLLLTATPNHSSSNDIKNIVSYFTEKFQNSTYKQILDEICIRRLRRLSTKALNKYNYRQETPSASDFREKPLSEMFFGLYQHELAKEISKNQKIKTHAGGSVSRMMKYLEGIEFLPQENDASENEDATEESESKSNSSDYDTGTDRLLLTKLSQKYYHIFNESPSHPKYEKLVEDLTEKHTDEKVVVFVRRIPSVREISRRVIEHYDKKFWQILQHDLLGNLAFEKLNRKTFNAIMGEQSLASESIDDNADEENKNIPSSKVLSLFKIIKKDTLSHTAASNFRLRFTRSKPGIFSMFFSPGEDYFNSPYQNFKSFRYNVGKEELENYYNSALLHRTTKLNNAAEAKDLLSRLLNKNPVSEEADTKTEMIPTLLTIFWEVFEADLSIADLIKKEVTIKYRAFSNEEKEAFSNFLEKGTILASEAMIRFYDLFLNREIKNSEKGAEQYFSFCNAVKQKLVELKLYRQIIDSILHFQVIYTKVFSINSMRKLLDESWDSFNNAQPIYPYNANNSNQKVLRCFNTPFYPDILVATSVLQEGVNLQYFCDTVYHYGMAWTPGDNEQRIGRIDRMFGKIERLLEQDEKSTLNIYYPYLKDTVDEDHLGRFAKRKYSEECLIDLGKSFEENHSYALEENDINGWSRFFRSPSLQTVTDPFPCIANDFAEIGTANPTYIKSDISLYYTSIINSLKALDNLIPEAYFINNIDNRSILLDPTINGDRKQPVVIDLDIDHIGSSCNNSTVYVLSMKTPIAPASKYKILKGNFYSNPIIQAHYLPGIKLCLDISQTSGSVWGIYVKAELPLFLRDLNINPLSVEEIQITFRNLIYAADIIEKEIFDQDLTKEQLNIPITKPTNQSINNFRRASKTFLPDSWIQNDVFLIKRKEFEDFSYHDSEKKSYILNHQSLFIKVLKESQKWKFEVAYLAIDVQKEEIALLEKHTEVFEHSIGWEKVG